MHVLKLIGSGCTAFIGVTYLQQLPFSGWFKSIKPQIPSETNAHAIFEI